MKILVIGDSCVDIFRYGEVNRLAPEAPVPIIKPETEVQCPGMAGNVVENLKALGAEVDFVTNKKEIRKIRYVCSKYNHLLLRVDENDKCENISLDTIDVLNDHQQQLNNYFDSDDVLGVRLLGIFSDSPVLFNTKETVCVSDLSDFEQFVLKNNIDEIFYTMPLTYTRKIKNLVDFCDKYMIRFKIVPDFRGFLYKRVNIDFFDDVPVITLREEPLTDFINRFIKRMFDLIFSSLVIIFILSWLFPVIAILIKLSSRGPILFKQPRSGVNNEEFLCYKFRSMSISDDADSKQATRSDPRITRIGAFLRKTSLDEFPQFFNVFIGDMSVVGPRPHMLLHTEEYSELVNKYMVRQLVKPGITGVAQVRGYRGETKELEDMEGRVRFDVWYIENWSLTLDINIILQTIWNIFKGDEKAY